MKVVSGKDLLGLGESMRELKDLTDPVKCAERAVIAAAEEWMDACLAADANQADYVDGGDTWQRCRQANLALRKSVDELRRARGEKGGEGVK